MPTERSSHHDRARRLASSSSSSSSLIALLAIALAFLVSAAVAQEGSVDDDAKAAAEGGGGGDDGYVAAEERLALAARVRSDPHHPPLPTVAFSRVMTYKLDNVPQASAHRQRLTRGTCIIHHVCISRVHNTCA